MSNLKVEPAKLDDYGVRLKDYGWINMGVLGDSVKTSAGNTSDMNGLLDVIAPAIREVAAGFGAHYDDLAKVVEATGTALSGVAANYAKTDHAIAQNIDSHAVVVGGGSDAPIGSGGEWEVSFAIAEDHAAQSDPAAEIRGGMDADVRAIDWVFNKFTGHHITEPIDAIIGNWTTLTARGESWADASRILGHYSSDLLNNAAVIDGVWDGVAATSFNAYMTHLGQGLAAESEIPLGVQLALDKLADEWKNLYQQAVNLLQSVIHDVEVGAAALAAGWWCGVGEAVAAKKCEEALVAFYRAYKIVKNVQRVIAAANLAVKGFDKLKDALHLATHIPQAIDGEVAKVKSLITDLGAVPSVLDNLSHLGDTPTSPYGGPNAPGIS